MPYEWVNPATGAPDHSGALSHPPHLLGRNTRGGRPASPVGGRQPPAPPATGAPSAELHLWPYRSLPRRGFVAFIGITFLLILLPLLAALGTPVLWGLLPFVLGALALMWYFLQRSYRDGELLEQLCLWPDHMTLTRHNPRGPTQHWQANPYWVRVMIHPKGGPVENYLTLQGGDREVELGAFLTPAERATLRAEVMAELARLRQV